MNFRAPFGLNWTWPQIPFHWPSWQQIFPNVPSWPQWSQWSFSLPQVSAFILFVLLLLGVAGFLSYHFSSELRDYVDDRIAVSKMRRKMRRERVDATYRERWNE